MEMNTLTLQQWQSKIGENSLIAKCNISRKDIGFKFSDWVCKKSFVPKDFSVDSALDKVEGFYVPAWLFEVSAESSWHGESSHTESRTVTKNKYAGQGKFEDYTDNEDYDVYSPVSSTHFGDYVIPVPASTRITQSELEALNFKRSELQDYDKSYLEGWQVLKEDVNKSYAKEICSKRVKEMEYQACKRQVEALRGCSTKITYNAIESVLLPVFVSTYVYKDKSYRNLINGQTGDVYGDAPIDKTKKLVNTVIQAFLGIVVAIVFFILMIAISRH